MSIPSTDETRHYTELSPVSGAWSVGLWAAGALALVLAALGPAAVAVSLSVVVAAAVVTVVVSSRGRATRPGLLVAAGLAGLVALPVAGLKAATQPADSALLPPVTDGQPLVVQELSEPNLDIPDNDETGIVDTIVVAEGGRVEDIRVAVDIAHTFVGDLAVELVAPSGQAVVLHGGDGGGQDDLSVVYDRATTPGLVAVVGDAADGVWSLRVKDTAGGDSGTLQSWELEVTTS